MTAIKTAAELAAEAEAREDLRHFAAEIEYFDTHDLSEDLEKRPEVHFEINLPPRDPHFAIERALAAKLRKTARQRGVSAEALLNEWVREKASESETVGAAQ